MWNLSFKSHVRQSYDTWLADPLQHQYTKGGNLKPPSRSLLCEWIKAAWSLIPEEIIKKSFLSCAIVTNTDGSNDDSIHCFKDGQPCEAGRNELQKEMEKMTAADKDADEDPFASEVDEEETEENEACIDSDDESDDDEDTSEEQ